MEREPIRTYEEAEPEQVEFAVQVVRDLISEIGDNWSGYGVKIWLQYRLRDLGVEKDDI